MAQDREEGTRLASVTNAEALDVGLCFGWLNGRREALDKGVERLVAEAKAETIATPLRVTKRGALAFGRKA